MIEISRLCVALSFAAALMASQPNGIIASPDAQTTTVPSELRLADRLLDFGDSESAALEYRRYLKADPEGIWAYHAWKHMAEALIQQGNVAAAELALRAAERVATGTKERESTSLRRGMVAMGGRNYQLASLTFVTLHATTQDAVMRVRSAYLAGMSALQQAQWDEARRLFAESSMHPELGVRASVAARLDSLLDTTSELPFRSPGLARWLSTFVPGAGQVYAGDVRNGLSAFVLNGLAGWLMVRSAQSKEWDEFVLNATFLFGRYYLGNRYQAGVRAERFNLRQVDRIRREATQMAKEMVGAESDE